MPRDSQEPQAELKLGPRERPLQRITINRMPQSLNKELAKRASRLSKSVPKYCRIVLEHALEYRKDYEGSLDRAWPDQPWVEKPVTVPVANRKFNERLKKWDPLGNGTLNDIAVALLKKHLEVRSW